MRERMDLLVSDCGQCRDHHVEAVEPSRSFKEMESHSARRHNHNQQQANRSEIAESFHAQGSAFSLRFQSKNKNRRSQWRRDESKEVGRRTSALRGWHRKAPRTSESPVQTCRTGPA